MPHICIWVRQKKSTRVKDHCNTGEATECSMRDRTARRRLIQVDLSLPPLLPAISPLYGDGYATTTRLLSWCTLLVRVFSRCCFLLLFDGHHWGGYLCRAAPQRCYSLEGCLFSFSTVPSTTTQRERRCHGWCRRRAICANKLGCGPAKPKVYAAA
ncbi:hypothetical protein K437DRAFT_20479 [Tilletiaria anomala UBC 951]|uniref:Uncharacterized protein n=1 Tax=Tilletiaria anomala (strain ATCC 24038 / CBS 436.72 / UBC 951) TaxID=1037660 RepID=A0A066VAL9_TILAU|nr:uncharacterized protein K437DRAFT_20479 [Tilletiaria anomala UBC 951]KDN38787.1 hypothetical protein K437DRAFT_20479 [Tilletiaria anomala UBC 951]